MLGAAAEREERRTEAEAWQATRCVCMGCGSGVVGLVLVGRWLRAAGTAEEVDWRSKPAFAAVFGRRFDRSHKCRAFAADETVRSTADHSPGRRSSAALRLAGHIDSTDTVVLGRR